MSSAHAELTLLIPGLAGPDTPSAATRSDAQRAEACQQAARMLTEALDLPGLSALLAYAKPSEDALRCATVDGLLGEAFRIPCDAHGQWPAAAIARQAAFQDAGDAIWMRADPVHLRPDMGKLLLFPPELLGLDLARSEAIAQWLNSHEFFPGPELTPINGRCWVARVDEDALRLRTFAPSVLHGRDADEFLPAGDGAAQWHTRMNEIQMLLHQCPFNDERERLGEAALNSVWFWGAGRLPTSFESRYQRIDGDHNMLKALAWCSAVEAQPLTVDGEHCAKPSAGVERQLIVLDELEAPAIAVDIDQWQRVLQQLDEDYLQAIAQGLRNKHWRKITLHSGRGAALDIEPAGFSRWVRRAQPLVDALGDLRLRCDL